MWNNGNYRGNRGGIDCYALRQKNYNTKKYEKNAKSGRKKRKRKKT